MPWGGYSKQNGSTADKRWIPVSSKWEPSDFINFIPQHGLPMGPRAFRRKAKGLLQSKYNILLGAQSLSRVQLSVTSSAVACRAPLSMDCQGKHTGMGCHFLLQGTFLTQGANPHLYLLHSQVDSQVETPGKPPTPCFKQILFLLPCYGVILVAVSVSHELHPRSLRTF